MFDPAKYYELRETMPTTVIVSKDKDSDGVEYIRNDLPVHVPTALFMDTGFGEYSAGWNDCLKKLKEKGLICSHIERPKDSVYLYMDASTKEPPQLHRLSDDYLMDELLRRRGLILGQPHVWDGADSHFEGRIVGLAIKRPWKEGAAGGEVRVIAQQEGTGILLIKGLPKLL